MMWIVRFLQNSCSVEVQRLGKHYPIITVLKHCHSHYIDTEIEAQKPDQPRALVCGRVTHRTQAHLPLGHVTASGGASSPRPDGRKRV